MCLCELRVKAQAVASQRKEKCQPTQPNHGSDFPCRTPTISLSSLSPVSAASESDHAFRGRRKTTPANFSYWLLSAELPSAAHKTQCAGMEKWMSFSSRLVRSLALSFALSLFPPCRTHDCRTLYCFPALSHRRNEFRFTQ